MMMTTQTMTTTIDDADCDADIYYGDVLGSHGETVGADFLSYTACARRRGFDFSLYI